MTPRIAVALFLSGALVALAGSVWSTAPDDVRAGAGAVVLGTILLLLGVHRRDRG